MAQKRGATQSGKKGGSIIDQPIESNAPKSPAKAKKAKKQSRGK